MTKPWWWTLRPFTPKSLVLVLLGLIFIFVGISAWAQPWSPQQREMLWVLTEVAPRPFWGTLMVLAGVASVVSSRWPGINDSWGFVALGVMSMFWACAFGLGLAVTIQAATGVGTWASLCVLLWSISRLVDPPPERRHE